MDHYLYRKTEMLLSVLWFTNHMRPIVAFIQSQIDEFKQEAGIQTPQEIDELIIDYYPALSTLSDVLLASLIDSENPPY